MDAPALHRTLVVANRTASTPLLLEELQRRAAARPTAFVLLIPSVPRRASADWTPDSALAVIRQALRGRGVAGEVPVEGLVGGSDAYVSIKEALADGGCQDVIITTLPRRVSQWLRCDLPRRVERLGVPVAVITPINSDHNWLAERFKDYGPRAIG
jgi:hypothetical protein